MERFFPEAAPHLDAEFNQIYNMTYNTFVLIQTFCLSRNSLNAATNVDTLPFRMAAWFYVQRIMGHLHDDYNYENVRKHIFWTARIDVTPQVNSYMNRDVKNYIKKVK